MIKQLLISMIITISFSGCIVGDVVALPFRVTGAVVNTMAPDIVGNSISTTGNVIDTIIPF